MTAPRVHRRPLTLGPVLAASVVFAACGAEPEPDGCGDPSMAIVTLQGARGSDPVRWCVDLHAAARVDATGASAGVDESYAVSKPGVYPWTNLTFEEASGACGRAGKFLCDYDTLRLIAPTLTQGGFVAFDETPISAVPRNGPETSIASSFEVANPVDMILAGKTGKPAFPETTRSIVYWTTSPPRLDEYLDESEPYVLGGISGAQVVSGVLTAAVVPKDGFRHPLLGFRCCIDAKLREAFTALGDDPARRRPGPDPEVPLAP